MKHYRYLLGFVLLVAGTLPAFSQVSNDNEDGVNKVDQRAVRDFVPGHVLVKFKDESTIQVRCNARGQFRAASINSVDKLLNEYNVNVMEKLFPNEKAKPSSQLSRRRAPNGSIVQEKNLDKVYWVKANIQGGDSTLQLIKQLKTLPEVEYAEPNYKVYITADVPSGQYEAQQTRNVRAKAPVEVETTASTICSNPSQNPLYFRQYGITQQNIHQLWNKTIINKKRPVIAILDTGVDITHPDLEDNIWTNTQEVEGEKAYDDDNNGIVDDKYGWNFVDNYYDLTDRNGHGTHVAGIAAAANNNIGIVGANPLALIMPVKVMNDRGEGDIATICQGIDYAVSNGADVINMSFGSDALANTMKEALDRAYLTAVLVASAGNNGASIYDVLAGGTSYPAAYFLVLGVEASGSNLQRASYSNYDPDGPIYSEDGINGCNYEVRVPGDKIYSTLPGGKYNQLSGTSMSAPLLAGAISALQMVKDYPSKDVLFGDLIHLEADFAKIYSDDTPRIPKLELVALNVDDDVNSNTNIDGQVDAGETIKFYPTLRNTWADATNIRVSLTVDNAYSEFAEALIPQVDFGNSISAYGQQTAQTPFIVQFANNVGNNTRIKFQLSITCAQSNEAITKDLYVTVNNMVKIGGMITEDKTLTADHEWLVTSNLAIPQGVTLTIEAGTTIRFKENVGLSNNGTLIADGTPEKHIFMVPNETGRWNGVKGNATLRYCELSHVNYSNNGNLLYENCILNDFSGGILLSYNNNLEKSSLINSDSYISWFNKENNNISNSNIINNKCGGWQQYAGSMGNLWLIATNSNNNWINSYSDENTYYFGYDSSTPITVKYDSYPYFGTSSEEKLRPYIYELGNGDSFAWYDLTNMCKEPIAQAHGIVWKVVVNGYDAQDEYEQLTPLGVGKQHKFEVYFNRPMNKAKIPQITFGVREPYTQHAVDEDGEGSGWNEAGTVYTAYKTITGRTMSDGVNRIYVQGAEDNEYFECPYENTRFNINIQAAGSMATGFAAEAGLGRVNLTWNNEQNDFEDAMGFNIYRYTEGQSEEDAVCINQNIVDIETTEYTDYDVVPGTTYYYMYKVLSTDLKEYDVSNVVSVTPLTAEQGDANGDQSVDVNDVMATVNYVVGKEQKPFIFEAADVNSDLTIDILDVIGIVHMVMNLGARSMAFEEGATATCTVEDGMLYIDTPVTLAGFQIQLNTEGEVSTTSELKGLEQASCWLTESDYRMLVYGFGSKQLTPGRHAVMNIGDAEITSLRLSDPVGHLVQAVIETPTAISDAMGSKVMNTKGVYNLNGQKVAGANENAKLRKGVYIVDGVKVVK